MASRSYDIPGRSISSSVNGGAVDLNFSGVNIFPPSAPSRSISGVQHRNNVNSNQRVRPSDYDQAFQRAFTTALGSSPGNQQRQTRSRPAASSFLSRERAFPTAAPPAQRSNPFHPLATWGSFPQRTGRQGQPGNLRHLLAPSNRQDRQPSPSSSSLSSDSSLSPPPSSSDSSELSDLLSGPDSSSSESEVLHELRSVAQRADRTPIRRSRRVGIARSPSLRHLLHSSPPRRNHRESSPASPESPATAPNNYPIHSPQSNPYRLPVSSRAGYSSSSSAMSTAGASRPLKRRATADDEVIIADSDDFSGSSPMPAAPAPPRPLKRRNTRQTQSSVATSSSWQQQQQQQPAVAQSSRQAQAAAAQSSREAQAAARRTTPAVKKQPGLDTERGPFWKAVTTLDDSDLEESAGEVIDLVDREDIPVPEPPKEDNSVRLGKFQCVICMDDCTDLTVTHCGHLFCSECLHSSLHIDATKKICPICRQKVDTNPASGRFTSKSKGFWPLELKLMTKKSSKKRAAR